MYEYTYMPCFESWRYCRVGCAGMGKGRGGGVIVVVRFKAQTPHSHTRPHGIHYCSYVSQNSPSQVLLTLSGTQVYEAPKRHL